MSADDDQGEEAQHDQDVRDLTRTLVAHRDRLSVMGRQAGSRMSCA